jgi:checkpoint serine/threonine-protein kinase
MKVPALKLTDFGSAIDMECFEKGTEFSSVVATENFICCEMRDKRNWTFQTDLFGVCGTVFVIVFGKYMEVEKKLGRWQITTKYPRYFQKCIWERFFNELLNIYDCNCMPNLQMLKQEFDVEVLEREKYINEKICIFNQALK